MATHWKKLTNPDYLGAYAFEPGEEKLVTIDTIGEETITGTDGKHESCTVAHFREDSIKPLILNATNCKAIQRLYSTPYIEEWQGKQIILHVQKVRAFGEVVDAVRVKPERPRSVLCECCHQPITAYGGRTPSELAAYTRKKYGKVLCPRCAKGTVNAGERYVDAATPHTV